MSVRYFGGEVEVQFGDRVSVSVWCRKRIGRIVYIPGLSPMNPEFEYNGLQWAGIRLENTALLTAIVRKSTGCLMERVRFLDRDDSPCELIMASSREFEEHGEGLAP